jgi:hypothetical protein
MFGVTIPAPTPCRSLHLVDLENLLGDQRCNSTLARGAFEYFADVARWAPGDQTVVAAHPKIVEAFAFDRPEPCNVHAVRGIDAADTTLLEYASPELVARRYGRLVIGSGDHSFIDRACAVRDRAVGVIVVSSPEGCAAGFSRHGFPVLSFDFDGHSVDPRGRLELAA